MVLRKIFFLFLIVLSCSAVTAQTLGFSITGGRKSVQIPIEIYDNLVVVPVIINSRLPLKFILDTGVRTTILTDKSLSDALKLVYSRKYSFSAPGGERKVEAFITNDVTIDIPGIHGEGHAMMVLAEDYLDLRSYLGAEVHGVLGYEIFSRFIVKIDYKRKILELMLPEKFKPGNNYQVLPMQIQDTKPFVLAQVQIDTAKINVKLLVDTGASHGLILEPESDERIKIPNDNINSIIGQGLGGSILGKVARINSLNIGHYKIPKVIANFPDPNSYMDSLKFTPGVLRNGTIGGEILSRFTVIFDFPQEKIYFDKNVFYKRKFYYNLSGLTVRARGINLRTFEIADVRSGSTADKADIHKGDVILSINYVDVLELNLNSVIGLFNSNPGMRILMMIERNGKKLKKIFYLQSQI